jgi:hypothetical protein
LPGASVAFHSEASVASRDDEVDAFPVDFPLGHHVVAAFLDAQEDAPFEE